MDMVPAFHHSHHPGAAGPEKDDHQNEKDGAEDDVEHGGVVESNCCIDDCRMPFLRNPSKQLEQ
ncbi:hypothetical protein [Paraburkholderia kirstenboschensis]|uniref:Uncharacterized protein n=1 Tax=Paraburkholderia kirstenboschensis TaxID=1245436 RepID=A0ABZ0EDD8_9BURK|nr:hypothetical protein [Paraburkholderia kirstenboschensis]WOD14198.1 hypothetical protein RW095_01385 [Paraburkholderia kirstenboschensis]